MSTVYTGVMLAVGAVTLLTVAWRFGRWQQQTEDHLKAQDDAIAELLREVKGEKDD